MANFAFDIDNAVLGEIVEQICFEGKYEQRKLDGESKNQFAKRMHAALLRGFARAYRARMATETAAAAIVEVEESDVQ